MEYNGCIWCEIIFATSAHRTQVLHLFTCPRIPKCSKTQPNIILGQMELNQCIWRETIFATSVLQSSGFRLEIQALHLLHAEGFLYAPKHNQTSFCVEWSRMDAFSAKPFPQLRYTK
jgi:hypothetical protein